MSDQAFERKVNAATHIDELAQVSKNQGKTKKDTDGRHGDFAKGGWDYRTAYFKDFDGKYYEVNISVAKSETGNVIYNIGAIKERSFPIVTGSFANGDALSDRKTSSKASISASRKMSIGNSP